MAEYRYRVCAMCNAKRVEFERTGMISPPREDDVASAITGTPYLSAAPTGYLSKAEQDRRYGVHYEDGAWIKAATIHHTGHSIVHGTEQSYQRGCRCGVCDAYTAARIKRRPSTVTYGPEGRTYDVSCPVHGSTHCHHLFDEPTGHTPSYECSCKDCLKKLGPFPLEDQVAPLMEASKLSEHEVRVMLWKSWLDLNPELKPVRQDRAAQEKKVALHVARGVTATFSWLLSVGCFLGLIIGLAISSRSLCAMSFAGFMASFLASLFLGLPTLRMPKLWKPKMGWRDWILSALGGLAFGLVIAFIFAVVMMLYGFAMMFYTAFYGPSNWPF